MDNKQELKQIIEAALLAAGEPLSLDKMLALFTEDVPGKPELRIVLNELGDDCEQRGIELIEVASGFTFRAKQQFTPLLQKLWKEKPPRYSRAILETLALIAYQQPITRAEIEDVRGVVVSTNMIKTLLEREWIKIVGHKDVPGKPALYGTTKKFLDYFQLKRLSDLPPLAEVANSLPGEQLALLAEQSNSENKTSQDQNQNQSEDQEVDQQCSANDEVASDDADANADVDLDSENEVVIH